MSTISIVLAVQARKLNMCNEREIEENEIAIGSNLSSIIKIKLVKGPAGHCELLLKPLLIRYANMCILSPLHTVVSLV